MKKEEIIDRLRDDNEYYGEFGKQFLSNSDINALINNPSAFKKHEDTVAMLQGRYFHVSVLEPEKLSDFVIIDASTRTTKAYKEALEEHGASMLLLQKEADTMKELADKMLSNFDLYDLIRYSENKYEEPGIIDIHGNTWKAKADIIGPEYVIDLKTTSDISKFKRSAYNYNYHTQAYIYQQAFGKPMLYIAACKDSGQIGMFECSPEFIEHGSEKVMQATLAYERFFGENATEDVNDYYLKSVL